MTGQPSPGPDIPAAARIYDYWGGGLDDYESDRDLAREIELVSPGLRRTVGVSRAFTARAVESAARDGISRFIDLSRRGRRRASRSGRRAVPAAWFRAAAPSSPTAADSSDMMACRCSAVGH